MPATRSSEQDAFIDLVCGDDDLVRAEFDAIVAGLLEDGPPPPDPGATSGTSDVPPVLGPVDEIPTRGESDAPRRHQVARPRSPPRGADTDG